MLIYVFLTPVEKIEGSCILAETKCKNILVAVALSRLIFLLFHMILLN